MAEASFANSVQHVRRSRRYLSRLFTRAAVGFAVGPAALALILPILRLMGLHSAALEEVAFMFWLVAWLLGTPVASVLAFLAGRRSRFPVTAFDVRDDAL